ncbi:MAG: FAD-binding oxidoreductase [Alteromonas sp.]|nr:FAD-binding oxidoreductase [Alteromonas sp.]MAY22260.1 FAD-binding oxidoreductase [Flavobacteriaceae bacterium]|tara:strand:+ start:26227 stop:29139 length:2913 start_codon:yes stop_codon:yes gene_type:complete
MEEKLIAFQKDFQGDIFWDTLHKGLYATDASVYRRIPAAVAYPRTTKGIQQLIAFASQNQTSLIPRTAGTSLAGQCVGEGIVVDVSRYFTGILSVDKKNKTVTVQPGVIRDELNDYLAPFGLFFGPNTSTSNRCMIGGMVGNNSSGTTSIQYGVTRDKIVSMKTILSNGEEVLFENLTTSEFSDKKKKETLEGAIYNGLQNLLSPSEVQEEIKEQFPKPSIHRRNTGYAVDALLKSEVFDPKSSKPINVCDILAGSEGTLAFTTEITLQLDELPPKHTAMIATQYNTLDNCMKDVVVAMQHNLFTCELMDDVILNCTKNNKLYQSYRFFIEGNPKAVLLLELRDHSEQELQKQIETLQAALTESNYSNTRTVLRGSEITMALELRKAGLGLLGNMVGDRKAVACIEDTAVAIADLPQYIAEFTQLMAKYHQEAVYYAHAGAGELHLRPILDLKKDGDVKLFREITTEVARLVKRYGGSFSGEHGDGIVRAEFLEMQIGTKNFELLRQIKKLFDPQPIFNPGKITDAWPMDKSLRYEIDRKEPVVDTFMDFEDSEGILRLAEKCNGSGDCRKTEKSSGMLCPSYHATKNEKDSTRGRANILREMLTQNTDGNRFNKQELKEAFSLCVGCKACATECPSNVDMATAKSEFLYQYQKENGVSRATKSFGLSSRYYKKAARFPKIANFIFSNALTASLVKKLNNVATGRTLPLISTKTFDNHIKSNLNQLVTENFDVLLFVDEFSNYLDAEIAMDAYQLLLGLGYKVGLVSHLDSARAMISKGFLEEAKVEVDKNIAFLKDLVSEETPLLGIEPSAILGFRDEYLRLANDKLSAQEIAKNSFLIEEFLASEIQNGRIGSDRFIDASATLKIHVHCHQKALSSQKATFDILNLPKNYHPVLIPSGCCGMAGSFGYEKEHYEVSMKIGETKLFPAIRKTDASTIIVANGTSCRHQIKDGTQREALHPITVLRRALL